ncbi:diguanylate cyclase [Marinospirillum alkaliphilum]|uniref:PAS domain S-box-containing protein/diguanylate cyclase (GGDEF) domain-containing protein n=1 Tax=Marinospirillum alkaliphilum DSM 21637 TaxID=1122209 RepID=A0A1K1X2S9_9GAMM|nr:diguanylate cyclase [Marinospirillum alkaliphilum]SFX43823.1 PAS domain S-box-containing protein/diguanylate cyclase (GGDEF) domain-containing protein [Marinospirillum alkaliphilum DSM 21637]
MSRHEQDAVPVVLLIEDEPGDARLIRYQLQERSGETFQVLEASSLGAAVSLLREQQVQPDVILLDLNLPDSTGTQTVLRCRELIPDVPIVVLTGLDDLDATRLAIEAGAEDYLSKGADGSVLRKAVHYALLRHQRDASERLALTVFNHAREGIMITDAESRIIEVNPSFTQITGYSREEALGRNPSLLSSGHHDAGFYQQLWQALNDKGEWQGEIRNRRKNGELFVESMTIRAVRDVTGQVRQYVALFTDVTEQKALQSELEHLAHFDALTGLPNRVLFNYRLKQSTAFADRHHSRIAVGYLDLDGFKPVNDTHGHAAGDRVLEVLAKRMAACLREEDTLARLGGDEFALVLESVTLPEQLNGLLNRLLAVVREPVEWQDQQLRVSASIGITFYPQNSDVTVTELLDQADQAMYEAKQAGRNRYVVFK